MNGTDMKGQSTLFSLPGRQLILNQAEKTGLSLIESSGVEWK